MDKSTGEGFVETLSNYKYDTETAEEIGALRNQFSDMQSTLEQLAKSSGNMVSMNQNQPNVQNQKATSQLTQQIQNFRSQAQQQQQQAQSQLQQSIQQAMQSLNQASQQIQTNQVLTQMNNLIDQAQQQLKQMDQQGQSSTNAGSSVGSGSSVSYVSVPNQSWNNNNPNMQ